MNDNRAKVAAKIKALLSKTVSNGCTESEAMAAAELANRLLAEYDLSIDDVSDLTGEKYGERHMPFGNAASRRMHTHDVRNCLSTIEKFTNTKHYFGGGILTYFGTETDTIMALWLVDLIKNSMELEYRRFKRTNQFVELNATFHGKTLRANFMFGYAMRINARLDAMMNARQEALKVASGKDLILLKNQLLEENFEKLGINPRESHGAKTVGSVEALTAGAHAAAKLDLDKRGIAEDESNVPQINQTLYITAQ